MLDKVAKLVMVAIGAGFLALYAMRAEPKAGRYQWPSTGALVDTATGQAYRIVEVGGKTYWQTLAPPVGVAPSPAAIAAEQKAAQEKEAAQKAEETRRVNLPPCTKAQIAEHKREQGGVAGLYDAFHLADGTICRLEGDAK